VELTGIETPAAISSQQSVCISGSLEGILKNQEYRKQTISWSADKVRSTSAAQYWGKRRDVVRFIHELLEKSSISLKYITNIDSRPKQSVFYAQAGKPVLPGSWKWGEFSGLAQNLRQYESYCQAGAWRPRRSQAGAWEPGLGLSPTVWKSSGLKTKAGCASLSRPTGYCGPSPPYMSFWCVKRTLHTGDSGKQSAVSSRFGGDKGGGAVVGFLRRDDSGGRDYTNFAVKWNKLEI